MKKGILTLMMQAMPLQKQLPLHSSCNVGKDGDVSSFFGLSGTGKTTLSADPNRYLIGDDEHVWTDPQGRSQRALRSVEPPQRLVGRGEVRRGSEQAVRAVQSQLRGVRGSVPAGSEA